MTKDEIVSMKAGVEMDALIAEKILGMSLEHLPVLWEEGNTSDGKDGWSGFVCPRCRLPRDLLDRPCCKQYSTDIRAAWDVVQKIVGEKNDEHDLFIECWSDGEWFVAFHPMGYSSRTPRASCDGKKTGQPSAPLAICRAALIYALEEE